MRVDGNAKDSNKIKVQVKKILDDVIECRHVTSNFQVKAFTNRNMRIEVGQVVLLEYRKNSGGGGYVVIDELMEEIEVKVIDAQHIISDGMMYTSVIMENPSTHQRLHSLVPSTNKLFSSTSIIVTGDTVKLKINNGNLFSIQC